MGCIGSFSLGCMDSFHWGVYAAFHWGVYAPFVVAVVGVMATQETHNSIGMITAKTQTPNRVVAAAAAVAAAVVAVIVVLVVVAATAAAGAVDAAAVAAGVAAVAAAAAAAAGEQQLSAFADFSTFFGYDDGEMAEKRQRRSEGPANQNLAASHTPQTLNPKP